MDPSSCRRTVPVLGAAHELRDRAPARRAANRLVVDHLDHPGQLTEARHCGRCQPHNVYIVACLMCGDGPILAGELAEAIRDADPQQLPSIVVDQLTTSGWRWGTSAYTSGW